MKKYWIAVISKDHISKGIEGGFIQVNHGKRAPLTKAHSGDGILVYSSKATVGGPSDCQSFTAIGFFVGEELFSVQMTADFMAHRRRVQYLPCREIKLRPIIDLLEFIPNKKHWGYPFRFGFLEIGEKDFTTIQQLMLSHDRE